MENPRYQCKVWSADFPTPAAGQSRSSFFSIEIHAQIMSPSPTAYGQIMLPQSQVTQDKTVWSAICRKLMEMQVPVNLHAGVIQKVVGCAQSVIAETRDGNMAIIVTLSPDPVAGLETVRVESRPKDCVVCLEDMPVGSEGFMLPCSHVYHKNCIRKWLRRRNLCPLCRFQMSN